MRTCKECRDFTSCMAVARAMGEEFNPDFAGEELCECKGFSPMTNADLIRARNDHELAESIAHFICDVNEGVQYSDNPNAWLEWLQQPAEVK